MSKILGNVYIESGLIKAFAKYILSQLYSHYTRNCTFGTFWRLQKLLLCDQNFILVRETSTTGEWLIKKKLPYPPLNRIFNILSFRLQHTFSFEWPDFCLKCLVTAMSEGQSPKFKGCVCNTPISEIKHNVIHFLELLIVIELMLWYWKES